MAGRAHPGPLAARCWPRGRRLRGGRRLTAVPPLASAAGAPAGSPGGRSSGHHLATAYCGASPLSLAYMKTPTSTIAPICTALAIHRFRSRRVMRPHASHLVSRFSCRKPQCSQTIVRRWGIAKGLEKWGNQRDWRLSHGTRHMNDNLLYQPS